MIPNFIDTARFRKMDKDHFKRALCPNDEKLLIHVSNFRPVKNATQVVEVFHKLKSENQSVKLLLVGDGPDRTATERLSRELGVFEDVRFLGKQEPIEEILSIADVFIMPSGSETFGLAALEAMACGVPVVASNIGGLPELITDGETGFLCPLDDVSCFADRIRSLLDDESMHDNMGRAAREVAADRFDVNRIIPMYEEYYERVKAGDTIIVD